MIELAPNSKTGLSLRSPFLLGSAAVGWGERVAARRAAQVVRCVRDAAPYAAGDDAGRPGRVSAEIPGGFILNTGDHNPGLRRVLRDDTAAWDSLGLPVIVALAGGAPDDWLRLGERLEEIGVAAVEVQLPAGVTPREAGGWIANLKRGCQLPVLAKVRATNAVLLAEACAGGGADALVVATAPRAAARAPGGAIVEGPVGGPAAFPFTLRALRAVAELNLGLPLVASGGITTEDDVRTCWELGVDALQLRSLLWTDPAAVAGLVASQHNPDREGDRV